MASCTESCADGDGNGNGISSHSEVAGNEVADVLANMCRIRGPAPVQRVSPQFLHDSARHRSGPVEQSSSILIDKLPDPMVRPSSPVDTASPPAASPVIATANVLTFHPQEEDQGETWEPSARRAALAKLVREVGVDVLGVQEGRSRKDLFVMCKGYAMWISAATPGGSGGTELWINTNSCDRTRAVVSVRDPSRLLVTCRVGGHALDFFCVHMHPRRTLLNGLRNGAWCSGRLATEKS